MSLPHFAKIKPNDPAIILEPKAISISFADLDRRSRRLGGFFQQRGLQRGDHIAILMGNNAYYHETCWAAQRAGLYYTPVNWRLTLHEAAYMIEDCGAKALIYSSELADMAHAISKKHTQPSIILRAGGKKYEEITTSSPYEQLGDRLSGAYMFYSSGTTGRPKGVKRPLPDTAFGVPDKHVERLRDRYEFDDNTVYLSPAPLYHAAPLGWTLSAQALGGATIIMDKFDAREFLALIEKYKVTHAQCVPTMFVRLLKLPESERARYDLSSLKVVIHAAAPCPVDIKLKMIDWFGPILQEYYAGSEGNGFVAIDSHEWLLQKGSVGKPTTCSISIIDENGDEAQPGETGLVYFYGGAQFQYHNDEAKTKSAYDAKGRSTLGDLGYLNKEGYLYLTGRRGDMINVGGVNVYPREIEDVIIAHPDVCDVAVVGAPCDEYGEKILAVIQLLDGEMHEDEFRKKLDLFCREKLAKYKIPKSILLVKDFPRMPTGKIRVDELRDIVGLPELEEK